MIWTSITDHDGRPSYVLSHGGRPVARVLRVPNRARPWLVEQWMPRPLHAWMRLRSRYETLPAAREAAGKFVAAFDDKRRGTR